MSLENQVYDASLDQELESRNKIEFIRDNTESIIVGDKKVGKIKEYTYKILIRDKEALTGTLTREEMDLVYKLYSSEGSNLTQRSVSRFFPNFTFQDFKRILRAFNITKASTPFAPHIIEEKTTDELITLTLQSKENDYLRKLEQDRNRLNEVKLKEVIKENIDLKSKFNNIHETINNINPLPSYNIVKSSGTHKRGLILHISDIHFGAKVAPDSLFKNEYNREVIYKRLQSLLDKISSNKYDTIVINLLGDMLDGMNQTTQRGGHILPQNMDNYEQVKTFIEILEWFIISIHDMQITHHIKVYSVKCGNHDGVTAYIATQSLFARLKLLLPNYEYTLFDSFFGYYEFFGHKWVITHGKDDLYMKRGLGLNMSPSEKDMIISWLEDQNIYGNNIHVIKGDLHSDNLNSCKKLDYRNCLSLFGASDHSNFNYSRNDYGVSYEVIEDGNLMRGTFTNL